MDKMVQEWHNNCWHGENPYVAFVFIELLYKNRSTVYTLLTVLENFDNLIQCFSCC